jgi:hypothetical protein
MKIKNFYSYSSAKQYFNKCSRSYVCYLIEDHETATYGVIDEAKLKYLQSVMNVHMSILYECV